MLNISKKVGELLLASGKKLITAESCTAGLISSTVAETPGSSSWLEGGFVVYTPQAKNKFLNVSLESIEKFNITSEQVAFEMAYGAIEMSFLEKGMIWITTFIALAPMLGFTGTVQGMVEAFDAIAEANQISPSIVATGIAVALLIPMH